MDHPERENKVRVGLDTELVGRAGAEFDAIREALTLGAAPCALNHLRLEIDCNDLSTRPNEPRQRKTEIPKAASYVDDSLTLSNELAKDRGRIVNKAPDWIIKGVTEPPGAGVRSCNQYASEETASPVLFIAGKTHIKSCLTFRGTTPFTTPGNVIGPEKNTTGCLHSPIWLKV